ncbi:glycosyltransferase [Geothrix sp.]|uniref:glycosyltransferase n=1 Tax=Geothrix sp. TaxID=1962974 RepID=UPI0025BE10C7|nr:glycosyltransferase [Geothrix sp.]
MPLLPSLESETYRAARSTHWDGVAGRSRASLGRYYRQRLLSVYRELIPPGSRVLEIGCGRGNLLAALSPSHGVGIDLSARMIDLARTDHPGLDFIVADVHELGLEGQVFDFIILSDVVNDLWDVQAALARIRPLCGPQTRLVFNYFSHLWSGPLRVAQALDLAQPTLPQNWLTRKDLNNLLELAGFEPLRGWEEVCVPLWIPLLSGVANRYLSKILPFSWLAMTNFLVARPLTPPEIQEPSVTVVIAARNESGHIEELLSRIPDMGSATEILFVEGNSTDDTYEVIQRAIQAHPERSCRLLKQSGRGKGDAVRLGFSEAKGDILMILDADITVPPEDLPRFYEALASGKAEFINGVRLVYPMEDHAMRFANLVGNKFFSWVFSWLLGQPVRDTLCGTKVLWRRDYRQIARNRSHFGDFDPFGDFDLLFGAARLNLRFMEVPVRYRMRRYGETNIQRWRHGWLLLKMVLFGARKIKFL